MTSYTFINGFPVPDREVVFNPYELNMTMKELSTELERLHQAHPGLSFFLDGDTGCVMAELI